MTEEQLAEIHERLREILLEQGARLDAIYYCPYLDGPDAVVDQYRKASELRKPGPGMLLQAADELEIDLAESWMVGDRMRDVVAGKRAGCRTILIDAAGRESAEEEDEPDFAVPSLLGAARLIVSHPTRSAEERSMPTDELIADREEMDVRTASPQRELGGADESHEVLREIRDLLRRQERRGPAGGFLRHAPGGDGGADARPGRRVVGTDDRLSQLHGVDSAVRAGVFSATADADRVVVLQTPLTRPVPQDHRRLSIELTANRIAPVRRVHDHLQPDPQRILIIMPTWVGDVVMTTPALRALRERFSPGTHYAADPPEHA